MRPLQVVDGVGGDPADEQDKGDRQQRLKDDAAEFRVIDKRRLLLR